MGVSTSFAQVAAKIQKASVAVERAHKQSMLDAGKQMAPIHDRIVASRINGPAFSGGGGRHTASKWASIPLRATAKPYGDGIRFAPAGRAAGPERVGESGRNGGMRTLGGGVSGPVFGQGKVSKKTGKALKGHRSRWNGTTKGKQTWSLTVEEFGRTIQPELPRLPISAMADIFR